MLNFIKNLEREKIIEKAKPLGVAAICFVAVFIAGYGVGKSGGTGTSAGSETAKRSLNYTTNSNNNSNTAQKPVPQAKSPAAANNTNTAAAVVDKSNCNIKGSKSKIYHMPGGSFYERTNPAACFNSEEEAQTAGYTKSSR